MSKKYVVETGVGIFVVIALICIGYLSVKLGNVQVFGKDSYPLKARFSSVTGLRTGNDVMISGVKVGQVTEIILDKKDFVSIVNLNIQEGISLSDDSLASIKTSGLIGDKYINISPGGSGFMLEPGDMLVETQAPVDFEDLVSKYVFGDSKE